MGLWAAAVLATLSLSACAPARPPAGKPQAPGPLLLQDRESYYRGSYQAHASPWSAYEDRSLVHKVDYEDVITIDPRTFPDGTRFDTFWPARRPTKGVWGYHALSFGNYDGGRPPRPVTPRQVRDIRQLSQSFDYTHSGSPNFNLLTEFYLTTRAGEENAKEIEVGIFLHIPQTTKDFAATGVPIGTYRDTEGRAWQVTKAGLFCMFLPVDGQAISRGRLDLRAILAFLLDKGVIEGDEWFNGIAFGMEPSPGGGRTRLTVRHWQVVYR